MWITKIKLVESNIPPKQNANMLNSVALFFFRKTQASRNIWIYMGGTLQRKVYNVQNEQFYINQFQKNMWINWGNKSMLDLNLQLVVKGSIRS